MVLAVLSDRPTMQDGPSEGSRRSRRSCARLGEHGSIQRAQEAKRGRHDDHPPAGLVRAEPDETGTKKPSNRAAGRASMLDLRIGAVGVVVHAALEHSAEREMGQRRRRKASI
jgi:hypothetical protein